MSEIVLSAAEIIHGAQAGVMRRVNNIKNNRHQKYGADAYDAWTMDIEGALGEMALAKYLGVYWEGYGIKAGSDVSGDDVRTTKYSNGRLIMHPDDHDDRRYWLVTGQSGTYNIRGWIMGYDGKHSDYWEDPQGGRAAYFVPQSRLYKKPPALGRGLSYREETSK